MKVNKKNVYLEFFVFDFDLMFCGKAEFFSFRLKWQIAKH